MVELLFNDGVSFTPEEYTMAYPICTIITPEEANISGFRTKINGSRGWDYSNYTTLYRQLENGFQLSCDGSTWVEPQPEPEPVPVPSTMILNGVEITVYDFFGTSFKTKMSVDEAKLLFENVTEYTVDDVEYDNLVYLSAAESVEFTAVSFRQKSEMELRVEELEALTEELSNVQIETYEEQSEVNDAQAVVNDEMSNAIIEIYEIIGGE